ncbi:MAG: peptide chain release factor N(5)-glutamine methyltransferase [Candidatus Sumerlaeaceae bacterium]|nr:peptide chain release factor N(5)-glutamine methyltransferase [Candidatus Sumerlaeaceae bacterium]
MPDKLLTVRECIARSAHYLREKGVGTARLDAELLVGTSTGMDRLQLYLNMDRPLDTGERDRARDLLRRRAAREPMAYILGHREFRSREFEVSPAVLIPRPETELLVDYTIEHLIARFPDANGAYRILELGAGSGAICVSLAAELPGFHIVATEISGAAAEVARRNAARHGVTDRIDFRVQGDFAGIEGPFHAVVSNPPYVSNADAREMEPEVRDHEPHAALFSGNDGLDAIRFLLGSAGTFLVPDGFLIIECGFGQAPTISELARASGWLQNRVYKDYAGIERFVLLEK